MLQILNKTPFEAALSLVTDQYGNEKVNIAVKGTFIIPLRNGNVSLAGEQLPVLYTDEFNGKAGESSVKYPADLVLGKKSTDIGLSGSAHSAGGTPVKQLPVSLKVGRLQKKIMVRGDRYWKKRSLLPGFYITNPLPFTQMPLVYERAFGGMDLTHKNEKKHSGEKRNPVGTGFRGSEHAVNNHKLPNLEDPDHPISNWKDKPPPACFGFADGSWDQRLKYAGTYDNNWLENQFPLLPVDFDLRFFNSADPDLISEGFLIGGEPVQIINASQRGILEFNLPELRINLMFRLGKSRNRQKADLWTVLFEPDEERFYMVWGSSFGVGKQPSRMKYVKVEMDGDPALLARLNQVKINNENTEAAAHNV